MARILPLRVELDGTGAGTVTDLVNTELLSFYVNKGGMTNNPAIVISDDLGRSLLTATITANTDYPLMVQAVDEVGAAHTNIYKNTALASNVTVTVTGGDASGVLTVFVIGV